MKFLMIVILAECYDNGTDPYDECGVCNGPGVLTFYYDFDNDGLGDPNASIESCTMPSVM